MNQSIKKSHDRFQWKQGEIPSHREFIHSDIKKILRLYCMYSYLWQSDMKKNDIQHSILGYYMQRFCFTLTLQWIGTNCQRDSRRNLASLYLFLLALYWSSLCILNKLNVSCSQNVKFIECDGGIMLILNGTNLGSAGDCVHWFACKKKLISALVS